VRSTDVFNLDFTTPSAEQGIEVENLVRDASHDARESIRKLERALAKDCKDESAWRLLASLYLGTDDMHGFNDLEARHQQVFGTPMYAILRQPRPPRDARRKLFDLPARITKGALPPVEDVITACTEPPGATLDFTRVRGADAGGLQDLAQLFASLPCDHHRPEMPGADRFITGLESAARSQSTRRVMWELLFAYDRLIQDQAMFEEHAVEFAARYNVPPPAF
jgi:hypothetical protein